MSRNGEWVENDAYKPNVTSRKGRVSRNPDLEVFKMAEDVTSRKGRVSRNPREVHEIRQEGSHVPQGACE